MNARQQIFFILLIITIKYTVTTTNNSTNTTNLVFYNKCCEQGSILEKTKIDDGKSNIKYIYKCIRPIELPAVLSLPTGCKEDLCVDVAIPNTTYSQRVVTLNCTTFEEIDVLNVNSPFNKCCPRGKVYNSRLKSCVKKITRFDPIKFSKVQTKYYDVGLPKCYGVIRDMFVPNFLHLKFTDSILTISTTNQTFSSGKFCVDATNNDKYVVRYCEDNLDVCKESTYDNRTARCFKKCCADGYSFVSKACYPTYSHGFWKGHPNIKRFRGDIAIVQPEYCIKFFANLKQNFHIDEIGVLHREDNGETQKYNLREQSYCMEYVENSDRPDGYYIFFCFVPAPFILTVKGVCLIISAFFLLLTIVGYLVLPELRNIYGKTLLCYCSSLLVAYTCLSIAILDQNAIDTGCLILGYLMVFTFLAAFSWLNVMCFDIWFTFSSIRGSVQNHRSKKKFIYYNIYAWSLPLIITGIIGLVNFLELLPDEYLPLIGSKQCFIDATPGTYGQLIFFRTPVAIIIIINCFFFISTTYHCIKVKTEINKMTDGYGQDKKKKFIADKDRLVLCLKLFIVMGVFWSMEVLNSLVSFKVHPVLEVIEEIFDFLNALQGVYVFVIYMLKRKVFNSLKRVFGFKTPHKPTSETAMT